MVTNQLHFELLHYRYKIQTYFSLTNHKVIVNKISQFNMMSTNCILNRHNWNYAVCTYGVPTCQLRYSYRFLSWHVMFTRFLQLDLCGWLHWPETSTKTSWDYIIYGAATCQVYEIHTGFLSWGIILISGDLTCPLTSTKTYIDQTLNVMYWPVFQVWDSPYLFYLYAIMSTRSLNYKLRPPQMTFDHHHTQ